MRQPFWEITSRARKRDVTWARLTCAALHVCPANISCMMVSSSGVPQRSIHCISRCVRALPEGSQMSCRGDERTLKIDANMHLHGELLNICVGKVRRRDGTPRLHYAGARCGPSDTSGLAISVSVTLLGEGRICLIYLARTDLRWGKVRNIHFDFDFTEQPHSCFSLCWWRDEWQAFLRHRVGPNLAKWSG